MKSVVSVLLITYNHEKYIKEALESVLCQETDGLFDYEILVNDDCSVDDTLNVVKQLAERNPCIRIFKNDCNMGATKNFYHAVCRAGGKYIAVLEGDDYWINPDKLKNQVKILEKNPDCIMCTHMSDAISYEKKFMYRSDESGGKSRLTIDDLIKNGSVGHTASVLFRNNAVCEKEWKQLYQYHGLMCDITLQFILLMHGNCYYMNEVDSVYRCRLEEGYQNASSVFRKNYPESYRSFISLYTQLGRYYNKKVYKLIIRRLVELNSIYLLHHPFELKALKAVYSDCRVKEVIIAAVMTVKQGIIYLAKRGRKKLQIIK